MGVLFFFLPIKLAAARLAMKYLWGNQGEILFRAKVTSITSFCDPPTHLSPWGNWLFDVQMSEIKHPKHPDLKSPLSRWIAQSPIIHSTDYFSAGSQGICLLDPISLFENQRFASKALTMKMAAVLDGSLCTGTCWYVTNRRCNSQLKRWVNHGEPAFPGAYDLFRCEIIWMLVTINPPRRLWPISHCLFRDLTL